MNKSFKNFLNRNRDFDFVLPFTKRQTRINLVFGLSDFEIRIDTNGKVRFCICSDFESFKLGYVYESYSGRHLLFFYPFVMFCDGKRELVWGENHELFINGIKIEKLRDKKILLGKYL